MKKITKLSIVSALAAALSMPAFALTGSGAPNGQHYTVNFVGMPKNVKPGNNDGSGGSVIFMPLDTSKITGADPLTCTSGGAQTVFTNDEAPTYYTADPSKGVKIGFQPNENGTFDILDNDATDSNGALISIPVSGPDRYVSVDLYVRVLGKPNTCAEISGYAYDADQSLWFWSGTIRMDRQSGKSTFVKATEIFDVWYCDVDPTSELCIAGTQEELSVFDSVFEDYFWDLQNNGTRLIQMRFYPK
jgi:hypothetical protein